MTNEEMDQIIDRIEEQNSARRKEEQIKHDSEIKEIHDQLHQAIREAADQTFQQLIFGSGTPEEKEADLITILLTTNTLNQLMNMKSEALRAGDQHRNQLINEVLQNLDMKEVRLEIFGYCIFQGWYIDHSDEFHKLPEEEREETARFVEQLSSFLAAEVDGDVTAEVLSKELDLKGNPVKGAPHADLIMKAINAEKASEEQIPFLKSVIPGYHSMANTKLSNLLPYDFVNQGTQALRVGGGKKKPIYTLATVTADFGNEVKLIGRPYTEFDRSVSDAIISLYLYGSNDHVITSEMVYRQMTHKTETEHISPQQKSAVTKSIEKQRAIRVEIMAADEFKKHKVFAPDGKPVEGIDGMLLNLKGAYVRSGGHLVKCYYIMDEPLQLTYSKMTNQLITVNANLLDVKEVDKEGNLTTRSVRIDSYGIPVRDYIIRRISVMKRDRKNKVQNQSTHIRYEQIYKIAEIGQDNKDSTRKIRNFARKVLDFLKATGFIEDYSEIIENRKITAVDIQLLSKKIESKSGT